MDMDMDVSMVGRRVTSSLRKCLSVHSVIYMYILVVVSVPPCYVGFSEATEQVESSLEGFVRISFIKSIVCVSDVWMCVMERRRAHEGAIVLS